MATELVRPLDEQTLGLFAAKGAQGSAGERRTSHPTAVKVRRVMQITSDLSAESLDRLRILDLACGEGVYAIEAALRGSEIVALDARTERMDEGARAARRLGLSNVTFEQVDVRKVTAQSHGQFDVIYLLGILYHLDAGDVFPVLRSIFEMCRNFVIIDTHISLREQTKIEYDGQVYYGKRLREHSDEDPKSVRRERLLASLDNTWSFVFTRDSLIGLLQHVGFSSVYVCDVPLEPLKPLDRITLVAIKRAPVRISSYPWINDKTESEIADLLRADRTSFRKRAESARSGLKQRAGSALNGLLRAVGFEISRIR